MPGTLIIARHHESEWNKLGKWTGKTDVKLTPYGVEKSREMSSLIRDFSIDQVYVSQQIRSLETYLCMAEGVCVDAPVTRAGELNERDYGDYTGKNKWEVAEALGEEEFEKLRREWDYPVPHGETLKMVYERVVPYYLQTILPHLQKGEVVLLVAHGNSLRALIKYLETISDDAMAGVEMPFGMVYIYTIAPDGRMTHKEVRHIESTVHA